MIPVLVRRGECDGLRRYCGEPSCVYAKLVSNVNNVAKQNLHMHRTTGLRADTQVHMHHKNKQEVRFNLPLVGQLSRGSTCQPTNTSH